MKALLKGILLQGPRLTVAVPGYQVSLCSKLKAHSSTVAAPFVRHQAVVSHGCVQAQSCPHFCVKEELATPSVYIVRCLCTRYLMLCHARNYMSLDPCPM